MPRKSRTDQELGWLRSLWEELAEAELIHGAFCRIELRPMARRGVFTVSFVMERPETEKGFPEWKGTQRHQYPNGQSTAFLSWLWGVSMRFGDYVDVTDIAVQNAAHKEG